MSELTPLAIMAASVFWWFAWRWVFKKKRQERVISRQEWRQDIVDERLNRQKRDAVARIESIKEQLTPAYRLKLQQSLAQWEAHLDSLEDDGVYAIVKGGE
jgi:hypothetical protein